MRLAAVVIFLFCTVNSDTDVDKCGSYETCDDCIGKYPCAWCDKPDLNTTNGCFNINNRDDSVCNLTHIQYPESSMQVMDKQTPIWLLLDSGEQILDEVITQRFAPRTTKITSGAGAETKSAFLYYINDGSANGSSVEIDYSGDEYIDITLYSKCAKDDGEKEATNKCDNIKVGQMVKFEVAFNFTSCPKTGNNYLRGFVFKPKNVDETSVVEFHMLCECPVTN